ncbi:TPA: hypothetical protein HA246_03335 [Candidatus Woesearchaeota archaeon]|nr:hypothetical protein [Candidatus Woesearchaeota archaeon]
MAEKIQVNTIFVLGVLFILAVVFFYQVEDTITGASIYSTDSDAQQTKTEKSLSLGFTGLALISLLFAILFTVREASVSGIRSKITKAYHFQATGKKEKALKEYHQVLNNYVKLPINEQQQLYPHLTELFEVLHMKK